MDEPKIKSIAEKNSMQPIVLGVKKEKSKFGDTSQDIKEIKLELKQREGDPYECYRGYNFEGELLFEYWKESVNVHYFTD